MSRQALYKGILFFVFGLIVIQAQWAQGRPPHGPTEAELPLLPDYCQAKLSTNPDAHRVWSQRMGKGWGSLHHYCFGLNFLNRAQMVMHDRKERSFNLNQARVEFNYVLAHWPPNFPLRGEAENYKALTEMMLNRR